MRGEQVALTKIEEARADASRSHAGLTNLAHLHRTIGEVFGRAVGAVLEARLEPAHEHVADAIRGYEDALSEMESEHTKFRREIDERVKCMGRLSDELCTLAQAAVAVLDTRPGVEQPAPVRDLIAWVHAQFGEPAPLDEPF
jgi:phage-related minor tail protein